MNRKSSNSSNAPTAQSGHPGQPAADAAKAADHERRARAAPNQAGQRQTSRKSKTVRAAYSMPVDEYAALTALKAVCRQAGIKIKRGQLLRAGLRLLQALPAAELHAAADAVRSGKDKKTDKRTRH